MLFRGLCDNVGTLAVSLVVRYGEGDIWVVWEHWQLQMSIVELSL